MFSSKKSKLMWHKIKNKKTLVLHLSNIYELSYLKNFEYALKNKIVLKVYIFSVKIELFK
jgi:hypothetical protein